MPDHNTALADMEAWDDLVSTPDEAEPVFVEGIVPLGHDRGTFYYLSRSAGQVFDLLPGQHTKSGLMAMASGVRYWQRTRHFSQKGGVRWDDAADDLMSQCREVGVYDPSRVRGRGAWIDDGRVVLHLGDRLFVDGAASGLMLPGSRHIYEAATRLDLPNAEPLPVEEAKLLLDLCMMPTWDAPGHMGRLLAGWCVIAPVCGAMPWRPHLWITGEKSSGKTWVMDNIVAPTVGSIAFLVQSVTTEAGIRQDLGCDARPVIFDEAETQTEADRSRIQNVLNLARQASTEGGAAIVKGSSSGKATHYRIRSMFAFSSINYGVTQAADESRVVNLNLRADLTPESQARFDAMRQRQADIITPDFAARLMARTISLIPTIRSNATRFADAIARAGHGRRTGDTVGVLLAGAWSLRSSRAVTADQADRFIAESDWLRAAVSQADVQPEWQRAVAFLLQHRVRVMRDHGPADDVPVAELVAAVRDRHCETAERALIRVGMRVAQTTHKDSRTPSEPALYVWNNSSDVASAFTKSPWSSAWLTTLARTPGAHKSIHPIRFGASGKQRALCLPLKEVMPDDT